MLALNFGVGFEGFCCGHLGKDEYRIGLNCGSYLDGVMKDGQELWKALEDGSWLFS